MADALFTKVTCRRCNGSGKYSFHLTRGTVCFSCNGSGVQLVDLKKEAAAKVRADKREAAQQAKREIMIAAWNETVAELNAELGPFDVSTELGIDQLNKACAGKYRKGIAQMRDDKLKK
jgi:hypothetical protein